MSNLSEDRQNYLAHLIFNTLYDDDIVDFSDEDLAVRAAKKAVVQFVALDAAITEVAKQKVASLKRSVIEGSPEWEILFKKYYEEEKKRRGK